MKHCIFHVPLYLDQSWISASHIRPLKMIQAFKEIGYEVEVIKGFAKERKKQILAIKNKINNGIDYDFLYSESSTMPTLLTERHHFPTYPCLDFGFFNHCKSKNIPIGLFYRDFYWKFDEYKKNVNLPKRTFATLMYKYDIKKYNQLLDIIYLPSQRAIEHLHHLFPNLKARTLPPGCENNKVEILKDSIEDVLKVIFVGAIGGDYNLINVFEAASRLENVHFKFCVRERDWLREKYMYDKYINFNNIEILHVSGKSLEEQYKISNLALAPLYVNEYIKLAVPFKLFEYIGQHLPIIGSKDTSLGEFVEKSKIGWTVRNNVEDIVSLLSSIDKDRDSLKSKTRQVSVIANTNRWTDRAQQVANDLLSVKQNSASGQ
jgi:glycosyltransferase involved in cell wall biosynthesis